MDNELKKVLELLEIKDIKNSNLPSIFDYQLWSFEEAFNFLLGVFKIDSSSDYSVIVGLNNEMFPNSTHPEIFHYLEVERHFMMDTWSHADWPDRNPPSFYIDWATKLGYPIDWLEMAIKNNLYRPTNSPLDKDLTTKEVVSYSLIIAALAKAAKIKIDDTSKASNVIVGYAIELGVKLSQNNVSDKLKLIPDALERAQKI